MDRRQHAARRLVQARVAYEREPDNLRLARAYERAQERYHAAVQHVRPSYLKGERL